MENQQNSSLNPTTETKGFEFSEEGKKFQTQTENQLPEEIDLPGRHSDPHRNKENEPVARQRVSRNQDTTQQTAPRTNPVQSEQVSKFIDEGNPNTQTPGSKSSVGAQTINKQAKTPEERATPVSSYKEKEAQEAANDEDVVERVRESITKEASLVERGYIIEVSISAGIVILEGSVSSEGKKKQAEHIAASIAGPGRVNNKLQVGRL